MPTRAWRWPPPGRASIGIGLIAPHRPGRPLLKGEEEDNTSAPQGPSGPPAQALSGAPSPRPRVLLTMRANFLEPAPAHRRLGPMLRQHLYALGPMGEEQLRHVVNDAVEAVRSVSYEAGPAERILAHRAQGIRAAGRRRRSPGPLRRPGPAVVRAGREEPAARRLFTKPVRLPADAPTVTRRTALRTELREDEWGIAHRLAATRLLVTGRTAEGVETVELAPTGSRATSG
ncbi:nSTAND1 domain-containing NTPase [Streptomyces orinoci]|uniref:Novel STAND NTPase 1 domain-containing protein n=1 Tax=Streptomyces orinoci TaxID=67339 RepID=A0ABV3K746_STRON|nr:hypothetical protein [Streptomyces orinoci]